MPVYILRSFGGVLILNTATPLPPAPPVNVTWITRDGNITWKTRDSKVAWTTRDNAITWRTRG